MIAEMIVGLMLLRPLPGAPTPPQPPPQTPAQLSTGQLAAVFEEAYIPPRLWTDFAAVSWCESRWKPGAIGDGGLAVGLFQIHPLWVTWAEEQGYGTFDRTDPVENARLAYLVGQRYDMPRYGHRWHQWKVHPNWTECDIAGMSLDIQGDQAQ